MFEVPYPLLFVTYTTGMPQLRILLVTFHRIHKKDIMKYGPILALHFIAVRNELLNFDGQNVKHKSK